MKKMIKQIRENWTDFRKNWTGIVGASMVIFFGCCEPMTWQSLWIWVGCMVIGFGLLAKFTYDYNQQRHDDDI